MVSLRPREVKPEQELRRSSGILFAAAIATARNWDYQRQRGASWRLMRRLHVPLLLRQEALFAMWSTTTGLDAQSRRFSVTCLSGIISGGDISTVYRQRRCPPPERLKSPSGSENYGECVLARDTVMNSRLHWKAPSYD